MSAEPMIATPTSGAQALAWTHALSSTRGEEVARARLTAAAAVTSLLAAAALFASLWSGDPMGLVLGVSWQVVTATLLYAKHACKGTALLSSAQRVALLFAVTLVVAAPASTWLQDHLLMGLCHAAAASSAWFAARMYVRAPRDFETHARVSGAYPIYRAGYAESR